MAFIIHLLQLQYPFTSILDVGCPGLVNLWEREKEMRDI